MKFRSSVSSSFPESASGQPGTLQNKCLWPANSTDELPTGNATALFLSPWPSSLPLEQCQAKGQHLWPKTLLPVPLESVSHSTMGACRPLLTIVPRSSANCRDIHEKYKLSNKQHRTQKEALFSCATEIPTHTQLPN